MEQLGKQLPPGRIGESLESGNDAVVLEGPLAGRTLGDLAAAYADELLGTRGRWAAGSALDFPLLAKFIDANEYLSVQVHPHDDDAPAGRRGKCEAWLILDATPDAELIVGIRGRVDPRRIQEQLLRRTVRSGDVFYTPPGTVHAIGGGILLYEIQQPSDLTYRLYDWGRARSMHLTEGVAVARIGNVAQAIPSMRFTPHRILLVACRYFALERRALSTGQLEALASSCRVLTVLDGDILVGRTALTRGESAVIAASAPALAVRGSASVLIAWVPALEVDIIHPLRAAGASASVLDAVCPDNPIVATGSIDV
jgi:mannose-6-phosphate isomerase